MVKRGPKKENPHIKREQRISRLKSPTRREKRLKNTEKGNPDTLLGDPVANTAIGIEKAKEKGQKDKIGIDDIGIFEFIFKSLPELPELEDAGEDRLK